jgi:hypothetical protein
VPDSERARKESIRRARKKSELLCLENGITRLVTLTTEVRIEFSERQKIVNELGKFVRRLTKRIPGIRIIWILEIHPSRGSFHAHLGIDRFVPKTVIAECWGLGFVDIRRLKSKGSEPKKEARKVAGYLSKYLGKGTEDVEKGKRRYSTTQNFTLTFLEWDAWELAEVIRLGSEICKMPLHIVWASYDIEDWQGPVTVLIEGYD